MGLQFRKAGLELCCAAYHLLWLCWLCWVKCGVVFRARSWNFRSYGSPWHHFKWGLLSSIVSAHSWAWDTFKFLKLLECLRIFKPKPSRAVPFTKKFHTSMVSVLKLPYSPSFFPCPIPPLWPAMNTLPNPAKHFTSVQGWMHIHRKQNREILSKMQTHTMLLDSYRQVQCLCSSRLSGAAAGQRHSDETALQGRSKILTEWKS